ncbi:transcription termination/antitermination protein NusG [Thalassospira marina]|uniref:Transcriptional activator RfaH n=1 Tax=Thalassospira marina TaxID=2048283 RepID=A0A2N3KVT2_9PROT|nr:transcriptional activator RfaH [Thalassospira marina]PKR54573.1 transcriptional activator RfaH [Thalassospira marina]
MNNWFVVNTAPHQEARAQLNLHRQGYETWLPVFSKTRRHARKTETVKAALFPGYIFLTLDLERDVWTPINGTFGVRRLVMQNGKPAALPARFAQDLRNMTTEAGLIASTGHQFAAGDKVRIEKGPFADLVAAVLDLPTESRVRVLLEVLGGSVVTTISPLLLSRVQ